MKVLINSILFILIAMLSISCASKKELILVRGDLEQKEMNLQACFDDINACRAQQQFIKDDLEKSNSDLIKAQNSLQSKNEMIADLRTQIADFKSQRDKQVTQVGDLTVLSQAANDNINKTLSQLEKKDKYIQLLNAAKSKADSINLALALNLKSVLRDGINDEDIDVKVDKTVVFINLSDKMLYQSGSANLTARANEVLGKIAQIVQSRPDLEVMVEGYTDNVPIKNGCMEDNWDLSVKRATSVVRVLQKNYGVNPNKLIAAGRGEYNTLADNSTAEGKSINRRTRIVILPKLNQFYDLLNPANVPQ